MMLIIYENLKWSGSLSEKQLLQEPIIIYPGIPMQILQNYSTSYFTKKFIKFLIASTQLSIVTQIYCAVKKTNK